MDNFYLECDIKLLTKKIGQIGKKKFGDSSASELAQNVIGSAFTTYSQEKNKGVTFEKFCWIVYRNMLTDTLRKKYVRKNLTSLNDVDAGKTKDTMDLSEDLVESVKKQAIELLENDTISLLEYNIIIMKSHRHENKDIAKELGLSEGRISQIWAELKDIKDRI
jgi:DNA-directed RNA polymerase specialized sigma subunit